MPRKAHPSEAPADPIALDESAASGSVAVPQAWPHVPHEPQGDPRPIAAWFPPKGDGSAPVPPNGPVDETPAPETGAEEDTPDGTV